MNMLLLSCVSRNGDPHHARSLWTTPPLSWVSSMFRASKRTSGSAVALLQTLKRSPAAGHRAQVPVLQPENAPVPEAVATSRRVRVLVELPVARSSSELHECYTLRRERTGTYS